MIFTGPGVRGVLESIIWVFLAIAICIPGFYFGRQFEERMFPILSNIEVSYSGKNPDGFDIYDFKFNKLRECKPLTELFSWYIKTDNGWERVYFKIPEKKGDPDRPLGKNYAPGWEVDLNSYEDGHNRDQLVIFEHQCHPLWKIKTYVNIKDNKVIK